MVEVAERTGEAQQRNAELAQCLYCGGREFEDHFDGIRDRLGYVGGEWSFRRCMQCRSLRLAPFPEEQAIKDFYPPVYSFHLRLDSTSRLKQALNWLEYSLFYGPQYRGQANQVLRGIGWKGDRGLRMLDVGCGRGLRLQAFQSRGFEVQGVDLQADVVEYVRRELGIAASVGGLDSLDVQFGPETFDVVTAFYLLEHVRDVEEVFQRCHRVLRPGGWFVGVVPICDGLQARLFGRRWIHVTEAPRHLSLPSHAGLLRAAERGGFGQVCIRSDNVLNCAGIVAGSLLPGSDLTSAYGQRAWLFPMLKRIFGGGLALAAVPFCAIENSLPRQTSHGMLLARKPE